MVIYIYNIHINRIICIYAYIHIQNNMYIYLYISCMYIYHTYIFFSRCTSQFLDAHPRWWCPPFQFPGLGLTYGALFGFIVSWHGTVGEQTYDFTEGFFFFLGGEPDVSWPSKCLKDQFCFWSRHIQPQFWQDGRQLPWNWSTHPWCGRLATRFNIQEIWHDIKNKAFMISKVVGMR